MLVLLLLCFCCCSCSPVAVSAVLLLFLCFCCRCCSPVASAVSQITMFIFCFTAAFCTTPYLFFSAAVLQKFVYFLVLPHFTNHSPFTNAHQQASCLSGIYTPLNFSLSICTLPTLPSLNIPIDYTSPDSLLKSLYSDSVIDKCINIYASSCFCSCRRNMMQYIHV